MTDTSEPKDLEQGKGAPGSPAREEAKQARLGEYVEGMLADILGTLSRFISTIFLFTIRPRRAAAQLSKEPPDYTVLVRPHTFLLLGCLFYSVFLSAIKLSNTLRDENTIGLRSDDTTEALAAGFQQLLSDGPSLLSMVITSLPILIVASLSAVLAGHIFKRAKTKANAFFLYLYGLEGTMILLFALSMETQGDVLMRLFGSDDYILLTIPALVLGIAVQAFRCLRSILDNGNPLGKVVRALSYLAFGVFFLVPMPLAGHVVVTMHQSVLQVKKENRERSPGPAIRIVDVTAPTIDGARMSIELSALVENRAKRTLALRPSDVKLEVYFVSPGELDKVHTYSRGLPYNLYPDLDNYDRYRAHLDEARIETGGNGRDILTLSPTLEGLITVVASQEVTSFLFNSHERDFWKDEDISTRWRVLSERSKPVKRKLEQVPELRRLMYVADSRRVIVRLELRDHTMNQVLASGFYLLKD